MNRFGAIFASAGDELKLEVSVSGGVTTFAGLVEEFTLSGSRTLKVWTEQEIATGTARIQLGNAQGYNAIVMPTINGSGTVEVTVTVGERRRSGSVGLTSNDSCGWTIFIIGGAA